MPAASLAEHRRSIGEVVVVHVSVFENTAMHAVLAIQTVELISHKRAPNVTTDETGVYKCSG
jgi:hypothetical protein